MQCGVGNVLQALVVNLETLTYTLGRIEWPFWEAQADEDLFSRNEVS